jgi:hypothetical protein
MCLAGQSYCASAAARERTALREAGRFDYLYTIVIATVSRWKGAVVELVERNWIQNMKTVDTKEVAEVEL